MLGGSIGPLELMVLVVVGLFVFGPERLPGVARDVARAIRKLRDLASDVTNDLKAELGPELADLDVRDLNPKAMVRKHLLDPAHEATGGLGVNAALEDAGLRRPRPAATPERAEPTGQAEPQPTGQVASQPAQPAAPSSFDDAT